MKRTDRKAKAPSRRIGGLCAVLALLAALAPSAAQGAQDHAFSTAFGSPGAGAGQLSLQAAQGEFAGSGVAVNEETGDVYVADSANHRVDEFSSSGAFIRDFGWEVNAEHPEAKLQTCTTATGCQAGSVGTEAGQLGNPTFVAVDNDPSSPSHGDVYVVDGVGVYGEFEHQKLKIVNATGGTFTLTFEGETTQPIPYNASNREVEVALDRLPAIGFGNVSVNGNSVTFQSRFAFTNVPQLVPNSSGLQGAGATVEVSTIGDGRPRVPEIVTKFGPGGTLIESWGESGQLSKTPTLATAKGKLTEGQAIGTGDFTRGSTTITNVNTESGEFKVGQGIEGTGVNGITRNGGGTTPNHITAVGSGTLTVAAPLEGSGTKVVLTTNNRFITNVNTESGTFQALQTISGAGIPAGTEIEIVGSGYLLLRRGTTASGNGVALTADFPFIRSSGITVDSTGRLWTGSEAESVLVFGFDQAGAFTKLVSLDLGGSRSQAGVALDSADDFYIAKGASAVLKYDSGGNRLGEVYVTPIVQEESGQQHHSYSIAALTRSSVSGDIFIDEGKAIQDVSRQCEPKPLGCLPVQEFGSGQLSEAAGLAVGHDGTLYAANVGANQIAVFGVSLEANVEAATEVEGTSAVLHGTVAPRGTPVTTCRFQAGRTKEYGRSLPCLNGADEEVGTEAHPLTGGGPVAVHAPLEGLESGTTYHFRLRARNGSGEEIHSEDEELETLVLPRIEAEEAAERTASSATLKAKINPLGPAVTACKIQWGATSEPGNPSVPYEHTVACEPASLPAGNEAKSIATHLFGLSARTTYHWRIEATDEDGTKSSPDHTFVFLPGPPAAEVSQECENEKLREENGSTALPDCRAYEQVTPVHKNGALIGSFPFGYPFAISQSGSRLYAGAIQCFGGSESCIPLRESVGTNYEFARGGAGWGATPLTLPASQFSAAVLLNRSTDSGEQLFSVMVPAPPSAVGREWFYLRHSDGSLSPVGPVASELGFDMWRYVPDGGVLASADLSHLVFSATSNGNSLWPFGPPRDSVYEYAGPEEHPFLVNVSGPRGSSKPIKGCSGARLAGERSQALSNDGRTVYFEASCTPEAIYARIDGELGGARTVKISAPAPEPQCDAACQARPPAAASFAGTSADGSMAYFLSTQQLTNEATQDTNGGDSVGLSCGQTRGSGCNLYLYRDPQEEPEPTGDHLVDVSAGDTSGQGPQVQGVVAISQDGRRVFFVAKGLLTGANAEGAEPQEGGDNLYVYDAQEERTRFVATLSEEDKRVWEGSTLFRANLTPDGRFLLFTSHASLTPDARPGEGPTQVYRYDAQAEALTRVSVGERGFNDNGNRALADAEIVPASTSFFQVAGRPSPDPSLSADGQRVFFESPTALTPGALDDVPINIRGELAENVYEWEEGGVGSCEEAGGCVYLISDGRDATEGPIPAGARASRSAVELIGTDQTGRNVFLTTTDQLNPGDTDTERDVYDARVEGGFAPPAQGVPCETSEACHPGTTKEGQGHSAATNGFEGTEEGPNHPYATKCPKPKVKRHGVCVRPHKHKRHKHGRRARPASTHRGGSR